MTYTPQQDLLVGVRRIDQKLFNFLKTVDIFLSQGSNNSNFIKVLDIQITSPLTISYTGAAPGDILIAFIMQDGVGHTVGWSSKFINPPTIDNIANTYSCAIFLARADGYCYLIGVPILGMHL